MLSFLIICSNYISKKTSIYLTMLTLTSYLLSFRNINLLGLNINASTFVYPTIFPLLLFSLDNKKIKYTKDLISKNNLIIIITLLFLMLTTGYIPSVNDTTAINIQNTIGNNFRILITYPLILTLSEYTLVYLYPKLKNIYHNTLLSSIVSLSITTTIDTILYNLLVSSFKITIIEVLYTMAITYIIKFLISLAYVLLINSFLSKKKVKK